MIRQFKDKVALITGGSRGIGRAIAERYLQEEMKVIICARDGEILRETTEALNSEGDIWGIQCDVSDFVAVKGMVDQIIRRHGQIDIMINNAAIGMAYGRVGEIDPEAWSRVIEVNLIGTFNCCQVVIPHMIRQGGGKIINLRGYGAGFPSPRVTAYGASKAGIVAFTRSVAQEYKKSGITVNLLSPGVVKTGLLLNREVTEEAKAFLEKSGWVIDLLAGPVESVAALAVKILSDASRGKTGRTFRVMSRRSFAARLVRIGLKMSIDQFRKLKPKSSI